MRIEVNSGEYKIIDTTDGSHNDSVLFTENLGKEIACSFFSSKLCKVALARNINETQLRNLYEELSETGEIELGLIKVQITGGDNSLESEEYFDGIFKALYNIDGNTNMLDLIGYDACERPHPDSIELNCYHGGISLSNYFS